MKKSTVPRARKILVVAAVVVATVSGASLAIAAGPDDRTHPRSTASTSTATALLATGQSTGGGCRMGYDTQTGTLIPPDDSTSDNTPAATVNIRKVCPGAVIGSFTSEVSTPNAGDFVHLDMRATCTGTGGMRDPCTVGQQVFASPGHTFLKNSQSSVQTHSMTMVWSGLKRGLWRFEVLAGGNGSSNLQFRSFVVEAFNAG